MGGRYFNHEEFADFQVFQVHHLCKINVRAFSLSYNGTLHFCYILGVGGRYFNHEEFVDFHVFQVHHLCKDKCQSLLFIIQWNATFLLYIGKYCLIGCLL